MADETAPGDQLPGGSPPPAGDPPPAADQPTALGAFLTALQFLLVSPAFIKRAFTPRELGAAVGYYPLVGLILGAILWSADGLLGLFLPPLVRAALVLALWVILTGALHLDGFLDACDGLLGGYTAEQRMQIMRDERAGAYALAGGALLLLIKFGVLASIGARSPALLLAPVLGRWGMAVAITAFPYGRPQGLGRDVKDNAGLRQAVRASVFGLIVLVGLGLLGGFRLIPLGLAAAAAALTVWLVARFTLVRIPGLTGDIYGAISELVETAVLVVCAAF
jgi:adenosylcobinamide-GDP ribazoletransferase